MLSAYWLKEARGEGQKIQIKGHGQTARGAYGPCFLPIRPWVTLMAFLFMKVEGISFSKGAEI